MTKKFLVTTPIYYSNDIPHIGHAYSNFLADVYARFYRLLGYEVKFSTGVDEHSQKIVQKAKEIGRDVYEYLDEFASKHIAVWDALDVSYTDFIRTTGRAVYSAMRQQEFIYDHPAKVQDILQKVYDKGQDIYQGEYVGLYCVGCESFKKETDLILANGSYNDIPAGEKVCPDHPNRHLEHLSEKNRFFTLSKYQQYIGEFYRLNPEFVSPVSRFHEVQSLLASGLDDFSISREGKTFGIKLPFDQDSVVYVWYDALVNYITVSDDAGFWTNDVFKVHVLAKDIVRFHAVYWPAMLQSAGYALPNKELVTGYLTVDGQKMSKSIGNVVNPLDVVAVYGRDALVFYLLYDVPVGSDGDYSHDRFHNTYDAILLNGWGNLVNRVVSLCMKNGIVIGKYNHVGQSWFDAFVDIQGDYFSKGKVQLFLQEWYKVVQKANEYMQHEQPWIKLKDENNRAEGIKDLQFLLWVVKQLAVLSAPILVESFDKVQNILGNSDIGFLNTLSSLEEGAYQKVLHMDEFTVKLQGQILYPRVEKVS